MANVVIAQIQNRRGERKDLPQPLNPGEFGFCSDTGQLFIGADEDTILTPEVHLFNGMTQYEHEANRLLGLTESYGHVLVFDNGGVPAEENPTPSEAAYGADFVRNGSGNRTYIGFIEPIVDDAARLALTDAVYSSTPIWVSRLTADTVTNNPLLRFEFAKLVLSNPDKRVDIVNDELTRDDADSIAEIMNQVYRIDDTNNPGEYLYPGLVTVNRNIEIITEMSLDEYLNSPLYTSLPVVVSGTWNDVPGYSWNIIQSNIGTLKYSLSEAVQTPRYARSGEITFVVSGTNANLSDDYTLYQDPGVTPTANVYFQIVTDGTLATLQYMTTDIDFTLTLATFSKLWRSF